MILSVSYDLSNPTRDYDDVISTIKSAPGYTHVQGSLWLIDTAISPSDWVDKLRAAGDDDDKFFVSQLKHNVAWYNIGQSSKEWLRSSNRTW